jgi:6-phosphofructokinase 1
MKIAVLTSGGDAPGMNGAIRAVVRKGISKGYDVYGVRRGYSGLIAGNIHEMGPREVGGIIQQGGTILGSARCEEFRTEEGRRKAIREMRQRDIEALVVIGGNGSQSGSYDLSEMGFPVVGVASTIDNDLYGSDITIGVDTALNVALEAIDQIKVTASSHQRAFLIELMGRNCGYLALMAGIAGGAEVVVIPERELTPNEVADEIRASYERGKPHAIIVVAEGAKNNADELTQYFRDKTDQIGFEVRVTKLGYVQRGGTPTAADRLLSTRLGAAAVDCIERGEFDVLVGEIKSEITTTPLREVVSTKKELDLELFEMADILAR